MRLRNCEPFEYKMSLYSQQQLIDKRTAKETSSLARESEEAVEDDIETLGDHTQSAWNQTKLAAYDAGERNAI